MKIEPFRQMLREFEDLVASFGNAELSRDLASLTNVMDGHENQTVAKFVDGVLKARDTSKQYELSEALRGVDEYLEAVSGLLVHLKKAPAARDVDKLRSLIRGFDGQSADSLASQIRASLASPPAEKKTPKAPLRNDLVRDYADALTASSENNDRFDAVVTRLSADKDVKVDEMRAIAEEYVGYAIGKKSRKVALQTVIDRQSLIARHDAKSKSFGGFRSWR